MHGEGRQSISIDSHQETLNSSSRRVSEIDHDGSDQYKLSNGDKEKEGECEKNDRHHIEDDKNSSRQPTYNEADLEAMGNIPIPQEAISTDIEVQDESYQSKQTSTIAPEQNANLIGWDGPNDVNNPKNFSKKKKWTTTLLFGYVSLCFTTSLLFFLFKLTKVLFSLCSLYMQLLCNSFTFIVFHDRSLYRTDEQRFTHQFFGETKYGSQYLYGRLYRCTSVYRTMLRNCGKETGSYDSKCNIYRF